MSDIVNNLEASTGAGFVILEGGSCLDLVCVSRFTFPAGMGTAMSEIAGVIFRVLSEQAA